MRERRKEMWKKKMLAAITILMIAFGGLTGCTKTTDQSNAIKPEQIADYLYYMELDTYNFEAVPSKDSPMFTFGCSSVRKGDLYGRNLDLGYCETPEFIVRLNGTDDRYASISVCADPTITPNVTEMTTEELLAIPTITNDGINENGVIVSVNVVDTTGVDDMSGTAPGKEQIHASRIVRYLLDHAESADHAVELMNDLDIIGGFAGLGLHWMIADEDNTYVAEIIDGQLVTSRNEQYYMTNFYLNLGPAVAEQYVADTCFTDLPLLNDYAIGVERWCVLRDGYDQISSPEDMAALLESVKGTAMYDRSKHPLWYSECCGGELSIHSDTEAFDAELNRQIGCFESRDRTNPQGDWISWHTSIYDIKEKTLRVYSQEDYSVYYSISEQSDKKPALSK